MGIDIRICLLADHGQPSACGGVAATVYQTAYISLSFGSPPSFKGAVFIDYGNRPLHAKEQEADAFAADFLIPPTRLSEFLQKGDLNKISIRSFASRIGIAPGIVVGRLQHDHILPFSHSNDLKRGLKWS